MNTSTRTLTQKDTQSFLLGGITLLTIVRILIPIYSGYSGVFFNLILLGTEAFRYLLIAVYLVNIVYSIKKGKRRSIPFTLWFLIVAASLIPTGHFLTAGALFSISSANPEKFRNDARELIDEYESMTCLSDEAQRIPCNVPIPRNTLPDSILNVNIGGVLILEDYAFIEKFGLLGLFRGFIVFKENADIWENEKEIVLLDGCSFCWKIRITDGLYWYHGMPNEKDISTFAHPLE